MKLVRYHNGDQFVTALAADPGRKYTLLVWIDSPVKARKVPNAEVERYSQPLPASLPRAARTMLKAGRSLGITKQARQLLRSVNG